MNWEKHTTSPWGVLHSSYDVELQRASCTLLWRQKRTFRYGGGDMELVKEMLTLKAIDCVEHQPEPMESDCRGNLHMVVPYLFVQGRQQTSMVVRTRETSKREVERESSEEKAKTFVKVAEYL
ncbi:hypothetical protein ACP4OV_011833 [Aristida adscensionis]